MRAGEGTKKGTKMQKSHIKEITFKMKQEIKRKRSKSQSVQTEETENT